MDRTPSSGSPVGLVLPDALARAVPSTLMLATTDCVKVIDARGRLLFMNDTGCRALGVDPGSGFGQEWLVLLPAEVRAVGAAALASALAGRPSRFPGRSVLPDGTVELWDNALTPIEAAPQFGSVVVCVSRDVTEAEHLHGAVLASRDRLALAASVGHLGVWDLTIATGELVCDETWHRIMGRSAGPPVSSVEMLRTLIHPDDVAAATHVTARVAELMESGEDYRTSFRVLRANGQVRLISSVARLVLDAAGTPVRAVGFIADATDEHRSRQELVEARIALEEQTRRLERLSREDPLTGLPNRRALDSELVRLRPRWARTGAGGAAAMVDIDHFKRHNDRLGHAAGDDVLRAVADCLRQVSAEADFVARYGGEEFVLVFDGDRDPAPVLDRLLVLVRQIRLPGVGQVTASCGFARFVGGARPSEVLAAADTALYDAKAAGRDRVVGRAV